MGGVESTKVTAGLAGFVVLFCLAIACWLLFRSMNKHLRRVRWQEEREEREAEEHRGAGTAHVERDGATGDEGAATDAGESSSAGADEPRHAGEDSRADGSGESRSPKDRE